MHVTLVPLRPVDSLSNYKTSKDSNHRMNVKLTRSCTKRRYVVGSVETERLRRTSRRRCVWLESSKVPARIDRVESTVLNLSNANGKREREERWEAMRFRRRSRKGSEATPTRGVRRFERTMGIGGGTMGPAGGGGSICEWEMEWEFIACQKR